MKRLLMPLMVVFALMVLCTAVNAAAVISVTGTPAALSTVGGVASSTTSFTFYGTGLTTATVTVTAPTGFEISTTSTGTFTSSIPFTPTGTSGSATIASSASKQSIFIRLASTVVAASSPYSGTITISGGGLASNTTVALASSTVSDFILAGSLYALYTKTGTPSNASGFTVQGSTAVIAAGGITITPPAGFEISNGGATPTPGTATSGFQGDGNPITVTNTTTTNIFIRLVGTTANTYSGNVTISYKLTSSGTPINTTVATAASVVSKNYVLAGFDFSTIGSVTGTDFGLTAVQTSSNQTIGSGVTVAVSRPRLPNSANSAGNAFGTNNLSLTASSFTDAVTNGDFLSFTITAGTNKNLSLTTIPPYNIRATNTGVHNLQWAYTLTSAKTNSLTPSDYTIIGNAINWTSTTFSANSPYGMQAAVDLVSSAPGLQNLPAGTVVNLVLVGWGISGTTTASGTFYLTGLFNTWGSSNVSNGTAIDFSILGTAVNSTTNVSATTSNSSATNALTLSSFNYTESAGPSTAQTAYISSASLSPTSGTLTAKVNDPKDYEISSTSATATDFGSTATLPNTGTYTSGTTADIPLYIRLKAGKAAGNYNSETVTVSGGNAPDATITLNGSVTAHVATIDVSQNSTTYADATTSGTFSFGNVAQGFSSSPITFTITNTGNNAISLTDIVSDNTDFVVSKVGTASSLDASGGTTTSTTYTITFSPTATPVVTETGTITITGSSSSPTTSYTYTYTVSGKSVVAGPQLTVQKSGNDLTSFNFGNQISGTTATSTSFTILSAGTQTLTLTGATKVVKSGTNASDFVVTQPSTSSLAVGASSTFTVAFSPTGFGTRTATLSIASNDNSSPYTITLTGTGTATSFSDIITNSSYVNTSNLVYKDYSTSTGLTTANSIGVQSFTIRDNGTTVTSVDNLPTTLTAIAFSTGGSTAIKTAALFDGTTNVGEVAVNGATSFSFSSVNLVAANASTKNFELRVTFQTAVTDQQQIAFTVTSATAASGGSGFATANAGAAVSSTTGNANKIQVTATKIVFGTQPTNTTINVAMSPAVTILAVDDNGNTDTHNDVSNGNITISSYQGNGVIGGTLTASFSGGIATFSNIIHTVNGLNLQLTATPSTTALGVVNSSSTGFHILTTVASWDFDNAAHDGSASTIVSTPSGVSVSNFAQGNVNGSVTFLSNGSPSSGYAGTSGGYNVNNAVNAGALVVSTSTYFSFTITPPSNYHVGVTKISFAYYSTGTGPKNYAIYSSNDGYTNALATGTLSNISNWLSVTSSSFNDIGNTSTAVTYRIYGYNGVGSQASSVVWRMDDISVTGSVELDQTPILLAYSDVTLKNQITSLSGFSEANLVASTPSVYYLTATNLAPSTTNAVTITPPTGYQLSTSLNGTYSSSAMNLNSDVSGNLVGIVNGAYPIYVRLYSTTSDNGSYTGSITNVINNASNTTIYPVTSTTKAPIGVTVALSGNKTQDYYNNAVTIDNVNSWGTNADGTGSHPASFIDDGQVFNINNKTSVTISGSTWTVSGTASAIKLGNGTTPVTLTVPATSTISGKIALANKSTITLLNGTVSHTYSSVDAGSTINYAQTSGSVVIPTVPLTGVSYGNLTLSGAGTKNLNVSNAAYTVRGDLRVVGPTTLSVAANGFGSMAVQGDLYWTGVVTPPTNGSNFTLQMSSTNDQTIYSDGLSDVKWYSLTTFNEKTVTLVKTGTNKINLKVGNASGGGITLAANSVLDLNGNDLEFSSLTGAGGGSLPANGTISTTSASNITLFKTTNTSLGTLNLTDGANTLGNLSVNYTGTAATALTLGTAVNLTGTLTVTSGTLATGGLLTLKSTSIANTAIVGTVGGKITGTVNVERFIPAGYRGYRDIAPEVYGASNTIYNTWQESGKPASSGIFITGPSATHADDGFYGADAAAAQPDANTTTGLDYSINGNASAYTYNNTNGIFNWNYGGTGTNTYTTGAVPYGITNTTTTALDPLTGFRVLVRGDRSFNLAKTPISNIYNYGLLMVKPTTLRATGQLIANDVVYNKDGATAKAADGTTAITSSTGLNTTFGARLGFSLVANPYVSPVQWTKVYAASVAVVGSENGINGSYWYLDPTNSATGTYLAYNALSGGSSVTSDATNSYTKASGISTVATDYIQPGQAFFVQSAIATPTVKFTEACKAASSANLKSVFGVTAPLSKIYFTLLKQDTGANYVHADAAAIAFSKAFTNASYGPQDALKYGSAANSIAITDKGTNLSIDGRLPATATDVLPIALSKLSGKNYKLVIDASAYDASGYLPVLKDNYKGTVKALSAGIDTITFTVDTAVAASFASRFSLGFKPTTLAVNSIVASASLNNKIATISWNTVGEKGVSKFEVEKSIDAVSFTKIGQATAKNTASASYSSTDNSVTATSYYRIKAISEVGTVSYSNVVKLLTSDSKLSTYSLYPNPLKGSKVLNVAFGNIAAGKYTVSITNVLGQKVQEAAISHTSGNANYAISINNTLAAGTYSVAIRETASGKIVSQSNLSVN